MEIPIYHHSKTKIKSYLSSLVYMLLTGLILVLYKASTQYGLNNFSFIKLPM